jgi:hypothetical protein
MELARRMACRERESRDTRGISKESAKESLAALSNDLF